jgi:alpha-L-rhamnosidase
VNDPVARAGPDPIVRDLRAEHRRDALGIGAARPRLSWRTETDADGWWQAAYDVECVGPEREAAIATIESDESVLVAWPFAPLRSRERVDVRVRVRGSDDSRSAWSDALHIEAGLLGAGDWSAAFVAPITRPAIGECPAWRCRREVLLRPGFVSARLYVTALGVYEAEVNGAVVGDEVLAPGWTVYDARLRYATHDVTALLRPGPNALGATVADGWYRGRLGFDGGRANVYGDRTALLAQLDVAYPDGTTERFVTDETWRAAPSPVLAASIYDGETYDARLEQPGWSAPAFDDAGWEPVEPVDHDFATLFAPLGPPVRRIEDRAPVAVTRSPSGRTIVDFGQNLVGRLRIRLDAPPGTAITLRHAEVLEDGELCLRPLRHAAATDRYIARGGGPEAWEPRFTFHGFRYAQVDGWPGELRAEDVTAVVIHSDLERTGWFACSEPLLERFHENVVWGMRGNVLDLPTDCPQRDERLGWTGDIGVFAPTAAYLYDAAGFLESWLADLATEQGRLGGAVPPIVPNLMGMRLAAAGWGDAATVVPSLLHERTGDRGLLETQYPSMCAWVDHVAGLAGERRIWEGGFQFGDWLDPTAPPDEPGQARTDKAIVMTGYLARSASLVARAAGLLGRRDDERRYGDLAADVAAAFAREFVTPAGRLMSDAETAYALAIAFDLLPTPEQRSRAGDRLAELVRDSGYHIRTGFLGTPLICDALATTGHHAVAYRLLLQRECPSWLYPVTMGATTIWERWDSMLPDGSINPGEMTSFNHYALGAVADWMHRTIGGIAPAAPGYRVTEVAPRPGGGLTRASARHQTPYGPVETAWSIRDGSFELSVAVPPNAAALVRLPGAGADDAPIRVGAGRHRWTVAYVDPDARGPWTLDDAVGEILTDMPARAAVMGVIGAEEGAGPLARLLPDEPGIPLRAAMALAPDPDRLAGRLAAALEALGSPKALEPPRPGTEPGTEP